MLADANFKHVFTLYASSGYHAQDYVDALFPDDTPEDRKRLAKDLLFELRATGTTPEHFKTAGARRTGTPAPIPPYTPPTYAPAILTDTQDPSVLIKEWRKLQAKADHVTAEMVRNKVQELINNTPNLTPSELKALASALADIQKIQRLALGLSSENVGMNIKDDMQSQGIEVSFVAADKVS